MSASSTSDKFLKTRIARTKKRLDAIADSAVRDRGMVPCPKCHGRGMQFVAENTLTPTGTDIRRSGECKKCKGKAWFPI